MLILNGPLGNKSEESHGMAGCPGTVAEPNLADVGLYYVYIYTYTDICMYIYMHM